MPAKGQVLSEAAILLMKKSRFETWKSKMRWDAIPQELWDVALCQSSRNRSKQFITMRRFKELVEANQDMNVMMTFGISKHLVLFMSKLAQGLFSHVTRDEFAKMYEDGQSLDEIAMAFKTSRGEATFFREMFGIKAKGAKFILRKETEIPITQRQKEIIYGSLMGDAGRMGNSSVRFRHGNDQKDYLLWKFKELENVACKDSLKDEPYTDDRTGYKGCLWRFYTHANSDIEAIIKEFYQSGSKQVTQRILGNLSPLSAAVWYQDDGFTDFGLRFSCNASPVFKFCTDSFSREGCEMIMDWFAKKWNISCRLVPSTNKEGLRVQIEKDSVDDFRSLIGPYMIPLFLYKIDPNASREKREAEGFLNRSPAPDEPPRFFDEE